MKFDVAISRLATFAQAELCKSTSYPVGDGLYDMFRAQAEQISKHGSFDKANSAIQAVAQKLDAKAAPLTVPGPESQDGIGELAVLNLSTEFASGDTDVVGSDPLVARMRSRRYRLNLGGIDWNVRTRASFTSCSLKGNGRPAKLWWSFEGISNEVDQTRLPSDEQVSALFAAFTQMDEAARDSLTEAYEQTLLNVLSARGQLSREPDRLKIAMTDYAGDDGVDALLDAIYLEAKAPSEIQRSNSEEFACALDGLKSFTGFVHHVAGKDAQIDDQSVSVAPSLPKIKGIVYRKTAAKETIVAGLARRVGSRLGEGFLSPEERRSELTEQKIRMRSAARPLSALLANKEVIALERHLQQNLG